MLAPSPPGPSPWRPPSVKIEALPVESSTRVKCLPSSEVAWQTGGRAGEESPREDNEGEDIAVVEVNGFPVAEGSRLGRVLKAVTTDHRRQTRDWDAMTVIRVETELEQMSGTQFEECVRERNQVVTRQIELNEAGRQCVDLVAVMNINCDTPLSQQHQSLH